MGYKCGRGETLGMLIILLAAIHGDCKSFHHREMDEVDVCIFTCDFCFKGDILVKCANECIALDGTVGPLWSHTCPFFERHNQDGTSSK